MYDYTSADLYKAYSEAGVIEGGVVYIESDMASLGIYDDHRLDKITEGHVNTIRELIGDKGTIVVPTATDSLIGSDIPFDINRTPSESGAFSEYIRRQDGAVRSMHPYGSYAAIGKDAEEICLNASHHPYGPESPMDRIINKNALLISIGLKPEDTCSPVHQVEMVMGVPYRYVKEFVCPIQTNLGVEYEVYYMHLWYRSSKIIKNKKRLWNSFNNNNVVNAVAVGRGNIYSYSTGRFYEYSKKYFRDNLYAILECVPDIKPYRK